MPKSAEQFADIREKSRAGIKDAAMELFASQGFAGTSVSQIAKKAGVAKGSIYHYFAGKEELLLQIFTDGFTEMMPLYADLMTMEDPKDRLRGMLRLYIKQLRENTHFWELYTKISMQMYDSELLKPLIDKQITEGMPPLIQLMKDLGCEDPEAEAYYFGAVQDGTAMAFFVRGGDYPLEQVLNKLCAHYGVTL